VLEFGTLIAGPFCSRILAEFGAEVIKIEAPGEGDPLRKWRKLYPTGDGETSLWWFVQARNKQSVTLNLKHPEGIEIAHKLVAEADIVVENFRPGVMEKLGLGWERCRPHQSGPGHGASFRLRSDRAHGASPGFGAIGESMGGLRYVTGFPDRPPVKTGHFHRRFDRRAVGRAGRADGLAPSRGQGRCRAGGRCRPVRGSVRHDGKPGAGVRCLRFHPRAHRQRHARHHAVEHAYDEGRQAPDHRRQRRRHFQAPDAGHRPCATWPTIRNWPAMPGAMRGRAEIYGVIDAWVAVKRCRERFAHCSRGPGAGQPIYSVADMFATPSSSPEDAGNGATA
jgi:hypothetical protein